MLSFGLRGLWGQAIHYFWVQMVQWREKKQKWPIGGDGLLDLAMAPTRIPWRGWGGWPISIFGHNLALVWRWETGENNWKVRRLEGWWDRPTDENLADPNSDTDWYSDYFDSDFVYKLSYQFNYEYEEWSRSMRASEGWGERVGFGRPEEMAIIWGGNKRFGRIQEVAKSLQEGFHSHSRLLLEWVPSVGPFFACFDTFGSLWVWRCGMNGWVISSVLCYSFWGQIEGGRGQVFFPFGCWNFWTFTAKVFFPNYNLYFLLEHFSYLLIANQSVSKKNKGKISEWPNWPIFGLWRDLKWMGRNILRNRPFHTKKAQKGPSNGERGGEKAK